MIFASSFNNNSTFFSSPLKEAIWRAVIPNYFCFFILEKKDFQHNNHLKKKEKEKERKKKKKEKKKEKKKKKKEQ